MAIPHIIQMQLIKKRLIGKEGKPKLEEIRKILAELPNYNTGPYGRIREWLHDEVKKTKTRSNVKHQDWLDIKKQGQKQFVLVGCPSVGKSSLIAKLSGVQTKIASYEFTTLRPLPATINLNGAYIQIIDLPGLIEGATEDVGQGKRLLAIVKHSDGILLMADLSKPLTELEKIIRELEKSEIIMSLIIIGNKIDLPGAHEKLIGLRKRFPKQKVLAISTTTEQGLEELKQEIWKKSNLIRVYPKDKQEPMIVEIGATIKDFVEKIHKDLLVKFKFATIRGTSAKFPDQRVGLSHVLEDNDKIDLKLER
jgi:uncharacterized protein